MFAGLWRSLRSPFYVVRTNVCSRRFCRPQVDVLEDRCVLSGISVGIDPVSNPPLVPENGVAEFRVLRAGGIGGEKPHTVTVKYRIEGNGLTADPRKDLDRTALTGTIRFGETETVKIIRVAIFNDLIDEPDETFTVRLTRVSATNGAQASIGNATGTFTVLDDDDPPKVGFTDPVTEFQWKESSKLTRFAVQLSAVSEKEVTVNYSLAALVDADQTSISRVGGANPDAVVVGGTNNSEGQVKFKPGQKKVNIAVQLVQDKIVEDNELFELGLRGTPVNAAFDTQLLMFFVIVDEDRLNISIKSKTAPFDQAQIFEGTNQGRNAVLEVVWDNPVETRRLGCQIGTLPGTATLHVDYGQLSGTVGNFHLFPANKYDISSATVTGDFEDENEEHFFVNLHSPTDRVRIVRDKVKIVIIDDD